MSESAELQRQMREKIRVMEKEIEQLRKLDGEVRWANVAYNDFKDGDLQINFMSYGVSINDDHGVAISEFAPNPIRVHEIEQTLEPLYQHILSVFEEMRDEAIADRDALLMSLSGEVQDNTERHPRGVKLRKDSDEAGTDNVSERCPAQEMHSG